MRKPTSDFRAFICVHCDEGLTTLHAVNTANIVNLVYLYRISLTRGNIVVIYLYILASSMTVNCVSILAKLSSLNSKSV